MIHLVMKLRLPLLANKMLASFTQFGIAFNGYLPLFDAAGASGYWLVRVSSVHLAGR